MPGTKISNLTTSSTFAGTDVVPIARGGSTLKVSGTTLANSVSAILGLNLNSYLTNPAVAGTTPLGHVLSWNGNTWIASASLPSGTGPDQVLLWNTSTSSWIAKTIAITYGGDLSGTDDLPKVVKIQGIPVSTATPTSQQVLTYSSSTATWTPSAIMGASSIPSTQNGSGYITLPNNLVVQWGYLAITNTSVNFPTAFPTNAFAVYASNATATSSNAYASITSRSTFFIGTSGTSLNLPCYWLAIGN